MAFLTNIMHLTRFTDALSALQLLCSVILLFVMIILDEI